MKRKQKTEKDVDSAGKRKIISTRNQGSENGQKREISDIQKNEGKEVKPAETSNAMTGSDFPESGRKCTRNGTDGSEGSRGCSKLDMRTWDWTQVRFSLSV